MWPPVTASLNPLCVLRYSATHRKKVNNIEQRSGRPVLTPKNALDFTRALGAIIESGGKDRE
jgi:restriction endonuclease